MAFIYRFPAFEEFLIDNNNLRIIFIPDHEQDGIVILLQFPFGRFSDPIGFEGLTELAFGLIQKGTKNFTSEQFTEKLEFTGANLFSDIGEEHAVLGMRLLSKYQEELFPLFFEMITKPRLEQSEFSRIQKEMKTALQAEIVDPGLIANRHFFSELAGKLHPAGRFHTSESLKKIKLEDVKKHLEGYFSPDGAVIAVAGDFEISKFKSRWVSQLEEWRAERKGRSCVAEPIKTCGKIIRLIDKPDLTQTSLIIGHEAPGELSPKKNEIALANYIFGAGNFSSRLMTRIRSSGGKTYGISSQISSEREFGAFTISTSTQNNQLGEVIQGILDEYRKFYNEGITDSELEKAKQFAIGNLAFQLEGIGNVAEKLLWLRFYGRSTSYIENFENMIDAVTKESVNNVIKETFFPDNLIFVAVGRKNETLAVLKTIGPVKEYHFRTRI